MTTAVVAQTKERAEQLAHDLGIEWVGQPWIFGARMQAAFEGLRVDLVLIDAAADMPDRFMDTITATVRRNRGGPGRIVRVSAQAYDGQSGGFAAKPPGVKVLGPFESWLGHHSADGWHTDGEGRLVITAGERQIATYNAWVSAEFINPAAAAGNHGG
ncbi:hypothetical protein A5721_00835 [Mycobacterium vulneris]|nr:hypothetical protein A5721_00835 [Mycolicibacterium vulneris]